MMVHPPNGQLCPLTVIGGFLGAGKTTLVNRLLATARGRYAVLVNDFGAINVDASLIAAHDGETLRLTNGCVCCSMADDFMTTLIRVLDAPEPFDHIIIEASGVGDPWSIAEIALVEPQLSLHAVIVVADAERLDVLLDDARLGDTLARQIMAADLLLLNKTDLADAAARARAEARLAALRPDLRIVPTVAAAIPEGLLDVAPAQATERKPGPARFRDEDTAHESLFHRVLYRRQGIFHRERLETALGDMPRSLLRLKGVCALEGAAETVLQLVGPRWSLQRAMAAAGPWPIELVGITLDPLAARPIAERLDAALAQDSHDPAERRSRPEVSDPSPQAIED